MVPRPDPSASTPPNLLTIEEQHQALGMLRDCLLWDPYAPDDSPRPDWDAISALLDGFCWTLLWERR